MATSPTDKSVKDEEEEEVRTEEIDPAKISDEEDEVKIEQNEVRTEEEEVKTEQEEVRTEEDEVKTEEVDPAVEDEAQTEEEDEPKEEAMESLVDSARNITTIANEKSDQGIENQNRQEDPMTTRGSDQAIDGGSTTSDQNRRLDSDPNASAESGQGAENQNPQEEEEESITVRRRSGQTMERGSTSSESDQNRGLVPLNPSGAQMSQQVVPHPFGLPEPIWLVVDHFYSDGVGLYGSQYRFRTATPLHPDENRYPLVMMEMPHHPEPLLVCYTQSFGVLQQDRLVPHVRPPMIQQQQQQQQSPFRTQSPPRLMMPIDPFVIYLGQVPVRPMMYYQEQDQIVLNAGQQAPVRPPPVTYNQFEAPLMQPPVMMCSPTPIVNAVPVRNYNQQQQFNQGQQRFRFPVNMIQHNLPAPSAASAVRPRPQEVNQQRQPRKSQGSNEGPSSSGESEG